MRMGWTIVSVNVICYTLESCVFNRYKNFKNIHDFSISNLSLKLTNEKNYKYRKKVLGITE